MKYSSCTCKWCPSCRTERRRSYGPVEISNLTPIWRRLLLTTRSAAEMLTMGFNSVTVDFSKHSSAVKLPVRLSTVNKGVWLFLCLMIWSNAKLVHRRDHISWHTFHHRSSCFIYLPHEVRVYNSWEMVAKPFSGLTLLIGWQEGHPSCKHFIPAVPKGSSLRSQKLKVVK